jgi:S-DNA-T family DNA segregation ATPase FtsK/SpoIIIE
MTRRRSSSSTSRKAAGRPSVPAGAAFDLVAWMRDHGDEVAALLLGGASLITILGLVGLTSGSLVDAWTGALVRWLGWFSWVLPATMALGALALGRRRLGVPWSIPWPRIVALEVALFCGMGALALAADFDLAESEAGSGGGLIGWGIGALVGGSLGRGGGVVVLLAVAVAALWFGARSRAGGLRRAWLAAEQAAAGDEEQAWLPEPEPLAAMTAAAPGGGEAPPPRARPRKPTSRPEPELRPSARRRARDGQLPALDLFDRLETRRATSREIQQMSALIERTLADFGIPAKVIDHRSGPSVTQFAVEPGYTEQTASDGSTRRQKVRVSQISNLADDLALALSAPAIRVEAPVPGQAYVGIEVPHRRPALVSLRAVMESEAFQRIGSPLTIALGRDVAGEPVAADLIAMPHLLIAGTTGSGKSVLMTCLAACLLTTNPPDDLQLVMIDPKMVELVRFNGVPHLMGQVETDLNRIVVVLRWCTQEMDRRYRELEQAAARDIEAYNRKMRRRRDGQALPRLVVMIDELADLMMMAPDQTERTLVRLAQMGRATGIHLVVATQRPSTDIVTGLIKANFPARISFAVPSMIDSRVILDSTGAETLLGKGDMLYLAPEAGAPLRLQGVFLGDAEVERLVAYWRQAAAADAPSAGVEPEQAPWEELLARGAEAEEHDDVLEQAIELVRQSGQASASMLQRRLRIGYPRAARLMDELEELGVVGRSQSGGRTREVLVRGDPDEDDEDFDEGEE